MIAALALALMASTTAGEPVARFAIAIGYNPAPDRPALRYADDDAARFYELFAPVAVQAHLLAAFDGESSKLFAGTMGRTRPPSRKELERAVAEVRAAVRAVHAQKRRAELYFFYAGHGDVDSGRHYVNMIDGRLYKTNLEELVIDASGADFVHLIVDSCHSFFLVAGRGPGGEREPYTPAEPWLDVRPNAGYVLSTSADAESHEWSALNGGLFSHEVRSGLLGGADADGDGGIDYDEIAAFVANANATIPVPKYRPSTFVRGPSGDGTAKLFWTKDLAGATRLGLADSDAGHLTVSDGRGLRYAELNKARGAPLALALLAPGTYEIEWEGRFYSVNGDGAAVALAAIAPQDGAVLSRGPKLAHEAFSAIFQRPFGPETVVGYRLGAQVKHVEVERGISATSVSLLAGGTAALLGGALLTVLAANQIARADGAPQADHLERLSRADGMEVGSFFAYGVGVSAIAAAIVLYAGE